MKGLPQKPMWSWTENKRNFDLSVAAALGLLVVLLSAAFAFPSLNPADWADAAAAAGLRPPAGATGGYIRGIYAALFATLSPDAAILTIRVAGWIAGGVIAMLAYYVIRALGGAWTGGVRKTKSGKAVAAVAAVVPALAFCCTGPVWYAMQSFGSDALQLVLALAAAETMLLFAKRRQTRFAYLSMAFWSMLAADCPAGIVGVFGLSVEVFAVVRRGAADDLSLRLSNPLVRINIRRFLTLIFLALFLTGVWYECGALRELGGYAGITEWAESGDGFVQYARDIVQFFWTAASWQAWVLIFSVVVAPMVVARIFRDASLRDETFIPANVIVAYVVIGVVAASQLTGIRSLRFDDWFETVRVGNTLVHAAVTMMSAVTLSWTMLILGTAVVLKRPFVIARFRFDDANDEYGRAALRIMEIARRYSVPVAAAAPVVFVLTVLPFRYEGTLRGMLGVINDYLKETVGECVGVTRLFTDGALDAGIELEAFRRGRALYTASLMSGSRPRELALRNRGLTAEDDLKASKMAAEYLLRMWVHDVPERLSDAAFQNALELWRSKKADEQPLIFGTVALPASRRCDSTSADQSASAERARALAERIIAIYEAGDPDEAGTRKIQELFRFVQWRLAQFCFHRSRIVARDQGMDAVMREQELGDRLQSFNKSFRELDRTLGRIGESRSTLLTPREGLRFALQKANFRQAAMFAQSIIIAEPDNPQANFALGMDYYLSHDYARAEPYLKHCLESRPDDPAVLNNLAVVYLRLYRFADAEKYALAALNRLPDSPEIKRTLEAIRKAAAGK